MPGGSIFSLRALRVRQQASKHESTLTERRKASADVTWEAKVHTIDRPFRRHLSAPDSKRKSAETPVADVTSQTNWRKCFTVDIPVARLLDDHEGNEIKVMSFFLKEHHSDLLVCLSKSPHFQPHFLSHPLNKTEAISNDASFVVQTADCRRVMTLTAAAGRPHPTCSEIRPPRRRRSGVQLQISSAETFGMRTHTHPHRG